MTDVGDGRRADNPLSSTTVLVRLNTGRGGINLKQYALSYGQPVELSQVRRDMITAPRTIHRSSVNGFTGTETDTVGAFCLTDWIR